ncbi:hypothetical protein H2198_005109 [Neophaeococcomyces mojaviensis]|uniref:Uncharacterized protein n=1 Tax=Neophaeococcomyces mojaviensis TaxID=3383035 RepID=A0ACC3A6P5_9EURO|nr:hypothetical protein H2198_005109 [Knufia sp. JES_112]
MAFIPDVSFFISFHELDPLRQKQCIHYTKRGTRCLFTCAETDNKRARELRIDINTTAIGAVNIDLLEEYILRNCCRSGNAKHRDRIQDNFFHKLLAQRWQGEIIRHTASRFNHTTTTEFALQCMQNQPRYRTRHYEANISINSTLPQLTFVSQPSLVQFRPHLSDPLASESVSWKILEPLIDRDFESGSVYIFSRDSSPGYVKIGWTAQSVQGRLRDWSKCGYTPRLLFETHDIPHAQRVETLTHYELVREWRRESKCKVCVRSHQEWFEISKEAAIQVLFDWAKFMKRAEPYDLNGNLKDEWKKLANVMYKSGKTLTAKELLRHYQESLVAASASVGHALKINGEQHFESISQIESQENTKALVHKGSSLIEKPEPHEETLPVKCEAPPEEALLAELSLVKAEKQLETDTLFEAKVSLETEESVKTKPLPKSEQVYEELLDLETTLIGEELLAEQIQRPPSPARVTSFLKGAFFPKETDSILSTGTEDTTTLDLTINSKTGITVGGISIIPKVNSSILAISGRDLSALTDNSTGKDTGNSINPSIFNLSDASSGPNQSDSSTTPGFPKHDAELMPGPSAAPLPLGTESSLSTLRDKIKKTCEMIEETKRMIEKMKGEVERVGNYQQNTEADCKVDPGSELLEYDTRKCAGETKSNDQDKSTTVEDGTETPTDTWEDVDDTLVGDQPLISPGKAVRSIVDKLCNEVSDEVSNGEANVGLT